MYEGVLDELAAPDADEDRDRFRRGYLQAIRDVINFDIEEAQGE